MTFHTPPSVVRTAQDLTAGVVVFLVALPLCLGVALASGAPLISGVLAGVVGGIVVGLLSGSHTSVSGPAAGLTAVVAAQIHALGTFETFLLAVFFAGLIQISLGLVGAGQLSSFFPSSVIKGLLAAIGLIIILKQIPHLLGHDTDPEGEMSFVQPDQHNTFSEFVDLPGDLHVGAAVIGITSLALLWIWNRWKRLKESPLPSPLVVVIWGVALQHGFAWLGAPWAMTASHLVQVPEADSLRGFLGFLQSADFSQWNNAMVYQSAVTIALVASLESLLNLEAVDRLDPQQRVSPPNRELLAQGVGNLACGMLGGIPVTSVIVRSSVNINAGGQTQRATIAHGVLLLGSVALLPAYLNTIPLACLAAILLATGMKLASPDLFRRMWSDGRYQFLPFLATVVAILFTDPLVGVMIGLAISMAFIVNSSLRRPVQRIVEYRLSGNLMHICLANQVSFLNRARLERVLNEVPHNGQVLLDATESDYIDPDILSLIREFRERKAPARRIQVSLLGFRPKYHLRDDVRFVDYTTRDLQEQMIPAQVLKLLREGNARFRAGTRLNWHQGQQMSGSAQGQHPLAVVLSCIDSRSAVEVIFDVGLGTLFCVRIAGNIISAKVLGSIEFACAMSGARLVVVMGHTRCGAVNGAVKYLLEGTPVDKATGCHHLAAVLGDIQRLIAPGELERFRKATGDEFQHLVDELARCNVQAVVEAIPERSPILAGLAAEGRIAILGAMYDVRSGAVEFLDSPLTSAGRGEEGGKADNATLAFGG